jgi:hypothetical protein
MKRVFTLIFLIIDFVPFIFGQDNDSLKNTAQKESSIDLCGVQTTVLSKDFYGFNFDFKYFPIKRIGTGLYVTYTQSKITDTFTYRIGKPVLDFYEIGWTNQYDILITEKVRIAVNLNNAISVARLGDDAIMERRRARYGYTYVPKEIATNYYYLLEPGADFSYKLFSFNHVPDVFITAKTKYRFLFGNSKYATTKQFSDYLFGIGISLIGYTFKTEEHSSK